MQALNMNLWSYFSSIGPGSNTNNNNNNTTTTTSGGTQPEPSSSHHVAVISSKSKQAHALLGLPPAKRRKMGSSKTTHAATSSKGRSSSRHPTPAISPSTSSNFRLTSNVPASPASAIKAPPPPMPEPLPIAPAPIIAAAPAPAPQMTAAAFTPQLAALQHQQHQHQLFNPVMLSSGTALLPKLSPYQQQSVAAVVLPTQTISSSTAATTAATNLSPAAAVDVGNITQAVEVPSEKKRKQMNAKHAKNARERKKNLMEHLEMEQQILQEENRRLRRIVKHHIPHAAQTILGECSYKPRGCGKGLFYGTSSSSKLATSDFDLIEALTVGKQSFVLTNPRLPDNPIVYASCSFLKMTGYTRDHLIGKNCRLLQGPETSRESIAMIRQAVQSKTANDVSVKILNYKADGTPFWNHLFVAALRDKQGNIINFVGVQSQIDDPNKTNPEHESSERCDGTMKQVPAPSPRKVEKIHSVFSNPGIIQPGDEDGFGSEALASSRGGGATTRTAFPTPLSLQPAARQRCTSTALDLAGAVKAATAHSAPIASASVPAAPTSSSSSSWYKINDGKPAAVAAAISARNTETFPFDDAETSDAVVEKTAPAVPTYQRSNRLDPAEAAGNFNSGIDTTRRMEIIQRVEIGGGDAIDDDGRDEKSVSLDWAVSPAADAEENAMDWANLAEVLEFDFQENEEWMTFDDGMADDVASITTNGTGKSRNEHNDMVTDDNSTVEETKFVDCNSSTMRPKEHDDDSQPRKRQKTIDEDGCTHHPSLPNDEVTMLEKLCHSPRQFVTKTLRSELIDAIMSTNGDVTDTRFVSALDVLSSLFKSTFSYNTSMSHVLNGSWKSISRPSFHYGGCLGRNDEREFVYTLGKMTFNMFNPGNLRCTVQHTMNSIEPVCRMDRAPSAAPWSLRRELASSDDKNSAPEGNASAQTNGMLKSYDISIAMTIEPGQFEAKPNEVIPSPPRRLRALQTVRGYFLPDPETPNRLTVWFTGGQLAPVPPPDDENGLKDDNFGTLDEWIALFGAEHKKTWGESLSNLGAQLFLGAELPAGMEADGSMAYTLHRPFGGHGKGYVDVLYVDDELLITQGNSKTVHVMTIKK